MVRYAYRRYGVSSMLYCKIAGKTKANARIYLNASLIHELSWLRHHIEVAPPICIFSPTSWDPVDAKTTGLLQLDVLQTHHPWLWPITSHHSSLPTMPLYLQTLPLAPSSGSKPSPSAQPSIMLHTSGHVTFHPNYSNSWYILTA